MLVPCVYQVEKLTEQLAELQKELSEAVAAKTTAETQSIALAAGKADFETQLQAAREEIVVLQNRGERSLMSCHASLTHDLHPGAGAQEEGIQLIASLANATQQANLSSSEANQHRAQAEQYRNELAQVTDTTKRDTDS